MTTEIFRIIFHVQDVKKYSETHLGKLYILYASYTILSKW